MECADACTLQPDEDKVGWQKELAGDAEFLEHEYDLALYGNDGKTGKDDPFPTQPATFSSPLFSDLFFRGISILTLMQTHDLKECLTFERKERPRQPRRPHALSKQGSPLRSDAVRARGSKGVHALQKRLMSTCLGLGQFRGFGGGLAGRAEVDTRRRRIRASRGMADTPPDPH
eukprot:791441-Pelagomonas_calceolata.AAC.2